MDLQHTFSSESCRSSTVNHNDGITLESPRKRQEVQEVMNETEGGERKRRRLMDVGHVKSHRRQSDVPEEGRKNQKPEEKKNSGRIRRNAGLRERSEGHGSGGSGRSEFRTDCDRCPAKADVSL